VYVQIYSLVWRNRFLCSEFLCPWNCFSLRSNIIKFIQTGRKKERKKERKKKECEKVENKYNEKKELRKKPLKKRKF